MFSQWSGFLKIIGWYPLAWCKTASTSPTHTCVFVKVMYPLEYSIVEIGMVIYKSLCEVHSVNINTLMQGLHMYKL